MMQPEARSIDAEAHLWRARKHEGLSADEQAEFQAWYDADPAHGEAYAEALLLWVGTGLPGYEADLKSAMADLAAQDDPETLDDPEAKEETEPSETLSYPATAYQDNRWTGRFVAGITAIAACLIAAISLGYPDMLFGDKSPEYTRYTNEDSGAKQIRLTDETVITLGRGAVLELALSDTERRGRLIDGDAFFNVTSDPSRPFTVATDHADIVVIGTSFDLQLQREALSVAVGKGSVRVSHDDGNTTEAGGQSLALSAGEAVEVSKTAGFGEVTAVYPAELGAWRIGRLIYRNAPLSEVVADLNRYGKQRVTLDPAAGDLRINGTFEINNMEFLLDGLSRSLPVRIEQDDETISIIAE
ncbi:MAG: FecR domain-containing protein [Pseudomonadota bacterium]